MSKGTGYPEDYAGHASSATCLSYANADSRDLPSARPMIARSLRSVCFACSDGARLRRCANAACDSSRMLSI
jgi:hypothetical protein